ncbi:MAG: type I asparaginase [Bacteroidia bacterium]|nr:type I asparaginase [Bacteroidia bacterium]
MKSNVLIIYTGGTIGMVMDPKSHTFVPFDFKHLYQQVPELGKFDLNISVNSFDKPIDSSDMNIEDWVKIASTIKENYNDYDGFVVLHGTDTMAFTASALSFMLENLNKPVILTGAQLPIGVIRTDGKENLITAIEIAGAKQNNEPIVKEVAIYFEYKLYRGNRTHKYNAEHFDAFKSPNYPILAEAGIDIDYNYQALNKQVGGTLNVSSAMNCNIGVLKLFPGITPSLVKSIFSIDGIKAVIVETFGSGNGTTRKWFLDEIEQAVRNGVIVLNITQCNQGSVEQGRYATSIGLKNAGVIGGMDMTFEAAVTKLMYLLGNYSDIDEIKKLLQLNLRGEISC